MAGYGTMFNEDGQYCILEQSFPKEQLNKSSVAYVHVFRTTHSVVIVSMCPQLLTVLDTSAYVFS